MTGPEHYREAARLLAIPADAPSIQRAQVHATLALAAAAAQQGPNAVLREEWKKAGAW